MHCPKCGSIINNDSDSCKFCKAKISAADRKEEIVKSTASGFQQNHQTGIQHKTITIDPDSWLGKNQLDALLNDGWKIVSSTPVGGNYDACNTCCLGAIFLPLALLGKKPTKITYVLEKDFSERKHDSRKEER